MTARKRERESERVKEKERVYKQDETGMQPEWSRQKSATSAIVRGKVRKFIEKREKKRIC